MDKLVRMKDLVNVLNKASESYYTKDNPIMSDKDYDRLYDELKALEKETNITLKNSPIQRIGDILLDGFTKVTHRSKLWSLDKAQTKEELEKFYNDTIKFTKQNKLPQPRFIITKKYDGLTLNCEYDNYSLKQSATRGTGEIGENVTEQSKTIVNLPHEINYRGLIDVHGECLMTKKAFADYNKSAETPLKNLRNGSAGALRNLNVKETAKRKLSAFFYDINYIEGKEFNSYSEKLDFIKEIGLPCTDYKVCSTFEEIIKEIENIQNHRSELQFDIDGVVVAVDDLKTREMLGYTIKFPKFAIAFKFEAEESTTKLIGIEWNIGRTGRLNPRGVLEPVELMGTTVSYATLNNIDDIRRKGVRIGSEVFIRRSNDVIPEIMGVVEDSKENTIEINPPTNCPSCNSELVRDGVHYFCKNTLSCKPQLVKSIEHFCSRECMNIEGFSIATAELFVDNNIINSIVDLYKLEGKYSKIINLPKFGVKKYNNLIESIEKSKIVRLDKFISALGIEGIAKSGSRDLCEYYNYNFERIRNCTSSELYGVKDFGEVSVSNVFKFFHDEKNNKMLDELLQYVSFEQEEKKEIKNGIFTGMKIYCTGTFARYKKEELKNIIEKLGGEFTSGYSKSLNYLVVGSIKGSSKQDKALKDGIVVLTEQQFEELIK